jgi:hypothetical protein
MKAYWALKNMTSLDGLPGLQACFNLEKLPESASSRRAVVPSHELAKGGVDQAVEEEKKREFAEETLRPVLHNDEEVHLGKSRNVERDPDRDSKMIISGFVVGLVAAAALDRLAFFLRSRR